MAKLSSLGTSVLLRRKSLSKLCAVDGRARVLDLMCGGGETWKEIKIKFPDSHITAVDFSDGMQQLASENNRKYFNNDVTILSQDIFSNQLPGNYFDIIVCAFGLKILDDQQCITLAGEVNRLLKPGGQFAFVELSVPRNRLVYFFCSIYIGKVLPIIARLVTTDAEGYKLLWVFARRFNCSTLLQHLHNHLLTARCRTHLLGCATAISGFKRHL